ncbi:hypothetical protein FSP39_017705 [Pinctada imbricata]|uniref:UDENN domain-containing protein n=1 Tax=Pinctada imbricata TaxID=66713 RepID=A0AA88Y0P0_PINIB|nr:hypothetical protein FSP39_017705 [Pinctada imbricata]
MGSHFIAGKSLGLLGEQLIHVMKGPFKMKLTEIKSTFTTNTEQDTPPFTSECKKRDINGDVLWVWSYPSVSPENREFFTRKSGLQTITTQGSPNTIPFLYSQKDHSWYYILTVLNDHASPLTKVSHISLVLVAKDFNPEKYEILCKLLVKKYQLTGSPSSMLESYLAVTTKGTCQTEENGKFSVKEYSAKRAYANAKLKGIIEMFDLEVIIIYTALLLKRRIAVYYPESELSQLISCIRSLPALVWHRQNWDIAFPYVELNQPEINSLKENSSYVAGFTDASVEGRNDLYDVFVNAAVGQISVASHAKEYFAMGKLHKETAIFMKELSERDASEEEIIKEIARKTSELINNLKSLAKENEDGRSVITLEMLKERRMAPATENFLFTLAACEGLVQV